MYLGYVRPTSFFLLHNLLYLIQTLIEIRTYLGLRVLYNGTGTERGIDLDPRRVYHRSTVTSRFEFRL